MKGLTLNQVGNEGFEKATPTRGGPAVILGNRYFIFSFSGNRLVVLIVTPTLPAFTDPFRRKINIHNIIDWLTKKGCTTYHGLRPSVVLGFHRLCQNCELPREADFEPIFSGTVFAQE